MTRSNIIATPIDKGNVKWNMQSQVVMATRVVNVKSSVYSHLSRFEIKLSAASAAVQLGCRHDVSCSLHCPCSITCPVWLSWLEERENNWAHVAETLRIHCQFFNTGLKWWWLHFIGSAVSHGLCLARRFSVYLKDSDEDIFTFPSPPILLFIKLLWNLKENIMLIIYVWYDKSLKQLSPSVLAPLKFLTPFYTFFFFL